MTLPMMVRGGGSSRWRESSERRTKTLLLFTIVFCLMIGDVFLLFLVPVLKVEVWADCRCSAVISAGLASFECLLALGAPLATVAYVAFVLFFLPWRVACCCFAVGFRLVLLAVAKGLSNLLLLTYSYRDSRACVKRLHCGGSQCASPRRSSRKLPIAMRPRGPHSFVSPFPACAPRCRHYRCWL